MTGGPSAGPATATCSSIPFVGTCSCVTSAIRHHLFLCLVPGCVPGRGGLVGLLLVVLLNGRHDGVAGGADELGAVLCRPITAPGQRVGRVLEPGRHVP